MPPQALPHHQHQSQPPVQQQRQQQRDLPGQAQAGFSYASGASYQPAQHLVGHCASQHHQEASLQQQRTEHILASQPQPQVLPQQPSHLPLHSQQLAAQHPPQLQPLPQHLYGHQDPSFRLSLPPRQFIDPGPSDFQPLQQSFAGVQLFEAKGRLPIQRAHSLNSLSQPFADSQATQPLGYPEAYAQFSSDFASCSSVGDFSGFASASSSSLVRYASFDMASASLGGMSSGSASSGAAAGPSRGSVAAEQANIDQLLAMSKAQAEVAGDANMFACPHCEKTYTGRHARSIWRRHLQDKHNIPLSIQPRRTRWDGDANRPKNAEERRARMLESKRRWARKKRQQEKMGLNKGSAGDDGAGDVSFDDGADADISTLNAGDDSATIERGADKENLSPAQPGGALHGGALLDTQPKLAHAKWPSPSRRVSEPNPFFAPEASGLHHYELYGAHGAATAAGQRSGPGDASTTPLNRSVNLYPTPPSSGAPHQAPATGFPGIHLYSSSPMRKAMSASTSSNAKGRRAPSALPLMSPPASDERSTALAYQQRMRNSATAGAIASHEGLQAPVEGYLAPADGAVASGMGRGSTDSVAATSVATPTSATFPGMPIDLAPRMQTQGAVPGRKTDQQEAAIQLLALRSNSNSPSDSNTQGSRKRRHASMDQPWDTPSKTRTSSTNAERLTRPSPSPRSRSSTNVLAARTDFLDDAPSAARRRSEPRDTPSKATLLHAPSMDRSTTLQHPADGSPAPAPRTQPLAMVGGSGGGVGLASSSAALLSLATPGPPTRAASNPFSLNKHKISPFEGKRRLSFTSKDKLYDAFGGELGMSTVASPIHVGGPLSLPALGPGGIAMEKSTSAQSAASDTSMLGPKLPPLVSTPIRPGDSLSAVRGTARAMYEDDVDPLPAQQHQPSHLQHGGGRGKLGRDILPPPMSTSKRAAVVSTPFSKPPAASGLSVLRLGASALKSTAPGTLSRPTPSKFGGDQFSSPQHLNLTESLGLAPHSISRTSYASLYGGSLGLTPSISALGGLTPGLTGFHTPFGAWPESARKGLVADDDDDDDDLENKPSGDPSGLDGKGRRVARGLGNDETPSKPSNPQRRKLQPLSLSFASNIDG
ncbi:uncharacterized protein PSFLO_07007 [Pseudozyma flocculosa]|nr:uncharacterized protein PSFLO_07007 [Pseudozyma flocculosa]